MSSPFERALREQLLAAAERGPAPRRWPRFVAVLAALAATAVAALSFVGTSPAAADIEITFNNGRVEVLLTDLTTSPDEVRQALDDAGLDARVQDLPAGPSNIGRFVQVRVEDDNTVPIEHIGGDDQTFIGFSLAQDWPGTLVISIGRPARSGEVYAVASDAFAVGEPLRCSAVRGQTLSDSAGELDGLTVRIQPMVDGTRHPPIPLSEAIGQYGDWYVSGATALSPTEVLVDLQVERSDQKDPQC